MTKLLESKMGQNNAYLKRFAVLHNPSEESLIEIAQNEKDSRLRSEAVLQLNDQKTLFDIAQDDSELSVKKVAVRRIYDKKKLTLLRIAGDEQIQPYIKQKIIDMNVKEQEFFSRGKKVI